MTAMVVAGIAILSAVVWALPLVSAGPDKIQLLIPDGFKGTIIMEPPDFCYAQTTSRDVIQVQVGPDGVAKLEGKDCHQKGRFTEIRPNSTTGEPLRSELVDGDLGDKEVAVRRLDLPTSDGTKGNFYYFVGTRNEWAEAKKSGSVNEGEMKRVHLTSVPDTPTILPR